MFKLFIMKKLYTFLTLTFIVFIGNAQIVTIPDAAFKAKLLSASSSNNIAQNSTNANFKIDANNDGEIQQTEAMQVYRLNVRNATISSLAGINAFTNLRNLNCGSNLLTTVNISSLSNLTFLYCDINQLSTLDLTNTINLIYLDCSNNLLSYLNLSTIINLQGLSCSNNYLTSLDESTLTHLVNLVCHDNQITSLNVNTMLDLYELFCYNNPITSLDLSNLNNLIDIDCSGSAITTLDASNSSNLQNLYCDSTPIETLFMKNGATEVLSILNSPNLRYICADENQIQDVQNIINQNGYINCHVNSYCSYVPGGTFYTIVGILISVASHPLLLLSYLLFPCIV